METFEVRTTSRTEYVEITRQVCEIVERSGVERGAALVCVPHTTAAVTVNEHADPDVMSDLMTALSSFVPRHGSYAHAEGNADAHVKAVLVGSSALLPIEGGKVVLGTWQGVFFCEFDGPRRRRVTVQVLACGAAGR